MNRLFTLLIGLLSLAYQPGWGQTTETEPNNSFTQANSIALDNEIQASLPSGDIDYFKVTISTPGVLNVAVEKVPKDINIAIEIFNASTVRLASEGSRGYGFSSYADAQVCAPGTYYVVVAGNYSSSKETFTLKATLDVTDVYECNNTFQTATPVKNGDKLRIALNDAEDVDYFKIDIKKPGILYAATENIPTEFGTYLQIYNSATQSLEQWSSGNGANGYIDYTICDPGIYYVVVARNNYTTYSPKLFDFRIGIDTADVYECNNAFTTAKEIKSGQKLKIQMADEDDADYFKINVTKPGLLYVAAENIPKEFGVYMQIFDPANREIRRVSGNSGQNAYMDKSVCGVGTYYVVISRNNYTNYSYDLFDLVVLHDTTDAYECNNTFTEAKSISIAKPIKATLADAEDVDFFKFTVDTRTTLIVKMLDIPAQVSSTVRIYNASQSQILQAFSNNEKSLVVNRNAYDPGVYYIRVERNSNAYSYNPYTLEVARDTVLPPKLAANVLSICPGGEVILTASECTGTVRWSTSQTGLTITVKPTAATSYTAVCEDGGRTSKPSTPLTISIKPVPTATASASSSGNYYETQTIQLSATGGGTYLWQGPNNYSSSVQNPSIANAKAGMSGDYVVKVTNTESCTASASVKVTVSLITGIEPDADGIGLTVSPNPISEECTIKLVLDKPAPAMVRLLSTAGKEVRQWESNKSTRFHEATFRLADLPAGLYIIQVKANDKTASEKVLKN
ncbi:T9SS type A sorting domain-containing protein [Spirosoma aureum]|uniref:T9SS type A sorting domain-containing protein n=1 Tax=Spirosoma aureum TaxID=2692134 RepID=A0A6G9AHX5_9BACT|nr:T9SS type A sorting domain-containing protein [Spirosoma aureum]QIP12050.1 T9SS type A sorting domain-containing protein [Spirosoma aureum]